MDNRTIRQAENIKINAKGLRNFLRLSNKKLFAYREKNDNFKNVQLQKQNVQQKISGSGLRGNISASFSGLIGTSSMSIGAGNIFNNIMRVGSSLLISILVNNLPKIIEKIKDVIDTIENYINPIKKFFDSMKKTFYDNIKKINQIEKLEEYGDLIKNIPTIKETIDFINEKYQGIRTKVDNLFGGSKDMVLAKEDGVEGFIDKLNDNKFIPLEWSVEEKLRYEFMKYKDIIQNKLIPHFTQIVKTFYSPLKDFPDLLIWKDAYKNTSDTLKSKILEASEKLYGKMYVDTLEKIKIKMSNFINEIKGFGLANFKFRDQDNNIKSVLENISYALPSQSQEYILASKFNDVQPPPPIYERDSNLIIAFKPIIRENIKYIAYESNSTQIQHEFTSDSKISKIWEKV